MKDALPTELQRRGVSHCSGPGMGLEPARVLATEPEPYELLLSVLSSLESIKKFSSTLAHLGE